MKVKNLQRHIDDVIRMLVNNHENVSMFVLVL